MKSVTERFLDFCDYLQSNNFIKSNRDLAKLLGISPSTFTEYSEKRTGVGMKAVQKIVQEFDFLNADWLLRGRGEMILNIAHTPQPKPPIGSKKATGEQIPPDVSGDFGRNFGRNVAGFDESFDETLKKVDQNNERLLPDFHVIDEDLPRLNVYDLNSKAAAGMSVLVQDADKWNSVPKLSLPHLGPGFHIRLQATGESMEGTIRDGDHIVATQVVEPLLHLREGFVYVLIDKDEGVVCKRVYKGKGDILKLESDNHNYKTYTRHFSDILAVFKVREVHKTDLRNHNQRNEEFRKVWDAIEELRAKVK